MKQCMRLVLMAVILAMLGGMFTQLQAQESDPPKASDILVADAGQAEQEWLKAIFGPGMWPIWLCSVFLVALIFERSRALKVDKIMDDAMIESVTQAVSEGKLDDAREHAAQSQTVVGQAWAQAFEEYRLGGVSLFDGLTNSTVLAFKPLKRNLHAISTLAVISPLFGLLGTVVGMIITFSQIAATGGADKAKLAYGIGLALFTTAGGLIVAIPAIVSGRLFIARLTGLAEQCEAAINRINYRHVHAQTGGNTQ